MPSLPTHTPLQVLRGLSGTKLTKPGTFRDAEGTGHAVRCSFKVGRGVSLAVS